MFAQPAEVDTMQEEEADAAAPAATLGHTPRSPTISENSSRSRTSFSCSPRDFRLPLAATNHDTEMHDSPRSMLRIMGSRRSLPRDKNKLRVADMIQGERYPSEFEVASEAKLRRRLGDGADPPHRLQRWRREAPYRAHPFTDAYQPSVPGRDNARITNLFGYARAPVSDVHCALHDQACATDEDLEDVFVTTPLGTCDEGSTGYSSDASSAALDEDDAPLDDSAARFSTRPCTSHPVPVPGVLDMRIDAGAPPALEQIGCPSPRPNMKRKAEHERSPGFGASHRKHSHLLRGPRKATLSASPRSTSPRHALLWGATNAAVSPSSSPLAIGGIARRSLTPCALAFTPMESSPSYPVISRPSSPGANAWISKTHSRSPSVGSGPGYGSGAIGLRIGASAVWDGVKLSSRLSEQAQGKEMDEGVRALELG
ncbi:hypothetical protein MVES1_001104 [Malassezia vespertilionis]|uniref:Uncharacterized protein n=1 Tax=Malassezia vespertilionis TaxID=2020962 RepID=A0A2N1JF01_9BASI|nr:uncharacterized protein MVES1_001104 [Malassezia vespertilionis]PKI85138.1 hypothetical protein MVES_001038 [Malassezia vespertilionis]WFD05771.1 hypothetical protein MVES1_001104 [Malassezia vespertilionis]